MADTFCSEAPSQDQWRERRAIFTDLGNKLYNGRINRPLPEKFQAFERELERCYCSGAYIACIILAGAISEVFMKSLKRDDRQTVNNDLAYLDEELKWLTKRRNDLVHFGRPSNYLDTDEYTFDRSELESQARQASAIVYHIARAFVRVPMTSEAPSDA